MVFTSDQERFAHRQPPARSEPTCAHDHQHQTIWTVRRPRRERTQSSSVTMAAVATLVVANLSSSFFSAEGLIFSPAGLVLSSASTSALVGRIGPSAAVDLHNSNSVTASYSSSGSSDQATSVSSARTSSSRPTQHSTAFRCALHSSAPTPCPSSHTFGHRQYLRRRKCLSRRQAFAATAAHDDPTVQFFSSNTPLNDDDLTSAITTAGRTPRNNVVLRPGDAVEIWHAKGIVLGNYEGPVPERRSLSIRLACGKSLVTDAGQIVGVWRAEDMAEGFALPSTPMEWTEVMEGVRELLQSMPARGLDLAPFWKAASSRGKGFVVTPAHAAEFLFAKEHRCVGLKKRKPFEFRSPGETFQPSAVERAAAAQLLAGELTRFKRVVSERTDKEQLTTVSPSSPPTMSRGRQSIAAAVAVAEDEESLDADDATGAAANTQDEGGVLLTDSHFLIRESGGGGGGGEGEGSRAADVLLRLGGFKAVDQNVAVTREVGDFCRLVNIIKQGDADAPGGLATPPTSGGGGGREGGEQREGEQEGGVASGGTLARAGLFEPAFLLILHSLEAYAIGGDEKSLAPEAKRVLETLGKVDPIAAKGVLIDVGLWTLKPSPPLSSSSSPVGEINGAVDDNHRMGDDSIKDKRGRRFPPIEAGGADGVIPWPAEVLDAASVLGRERARRWQNYEKREPEVVVGAPAPFGRHDFRAAEFGVYCIDGDGARFLDDAFSIDPKTREVFIHITDVQSLVPQGSTLDEVARLRAASEYLPQGPLFMMPPTALKALSFNDRGPNEAVTVGIKLDPKTGWMISSRVMLTTLPPAVPLTFAQADRLLEEGDAEKETGGRRSRVAAELKALEYVSRRSAEAAGRRRRSHDGVQLRSADSEGEMQATEVPKSRALSLVDELLTVYTLEVFALCRRASVAMPTLVGHQDRVAAGKSRYGTGPLRRYVDILAQRQVAAILRGTGYLSKNYLLATASYLTWRQNKTRARRQEEAGRLSLEALASHCRAQMKATGVPHAVIPGRGTGEGRQVRLDGLGVTVHVKRAPGAGGRGNAIAKGKPVKVVIERVEPQLKQVVATEYDER